MENINLISVFQHIVEKNEQLSHEKEELRKKYLNTILEAIDTLVSSAKDETEYLVIFLKTSSAGELVIEDGLHREIWSMQDQRGVLNQQNVLEYLRNIGYSKTKLDDQTQTIEITWSDKVIY